MTNGRGLLLVLSHMRSYSTLLTHLLSEHRTINGWRELHKSYTTVGDVTETIDRLCKSRIHETACDNLLHNHYTASDQVLTSPNVRCIISIRNAYPTLQSLWRWGGPNNKFRVAGVAADYYCDRLEELLRMGESMGGDFLLLRSDRLVNLPEQTTSELSVFLGLTPQLSASYTPRRGTGDPRYGDFSRFIGSGEIVQDREYRLQPPIQEADHRRCHRVRGEVLNQLKSLNPGLI